MTRRGDKGGRGSVRGREGAGNGGRRAAAVGHRKALEAQRLDGGGGLPSGGERGRIRECEREGDTEMWLVWLG